MRNFKEKIELFFIFFLNKKIKESFNELGITIMDYIFKFLMMEYNCLFSEDNGLIIGGVICVVCKMLEKMGSSFSLNSIVKNYLLFVSFIFFLRKVRKIDGFAEL